VFATAGLTPLKVLQTTTLKEPKVVDLVVLQGNHLANVQSLYRAHALTRAGSTTPTAISRRSSTMSRLPDRSTNCQWHECEEMPS
jgi:hypothetical protein